MSLSSQQHNLTALYYSGSRTDTIAQLREAIPDTDEPDILADLMSAITVLKSMSESDFDSLATGFEGGMRYSETG